jgi:hypothetical protein
VKHGVGHQMIELFIFHTTFRKRACLTPQLTGAILPPRPCYRLVRREPM